MKKYIYFLSFSAFLAFSGCDSSSYSLRKFRKNFEKSEPYIEQKTEKPERKCSEVVNILKNATVEIRLDIKSAHLFLLATVEKREFEDNRGSSLENKRRELRELQEAMAPGITKQNTGRIGNLENKCTDLEKYFLEINNISQPKRAKLEEEANLIKDEAIKKTQLEKFREQQAAYNIGYAIIQDKLKALFAKVSLAKDQEIVLKQSQGFEEIKTETKKFAPIFDDMDNLLGEIAESADRLCLPEAKQ